MFNAEIILNASYSWSIYSNVSYSVKSYIWSAFPVRTETQAYILILKSMYWIYQYKKILAELKGLSIWLVNCIRGIKH